MARSVYLAPRQRRSIASGVRGQIGVHALAHVEVASTLVTAALRPHPRVEARCAKQKIARKLRHATCKVVAQTASTETGLHGVTGVPALTLVEVALVGAHEKSRQKLTSAVNQQSDSRRSMSSAMKQFLVPKMSTAHLVTGVRGVIAHALAMG